MMTLILEFLVILPVFLFAIMIHEIAHGWVAYKLGDPTAKNSGRLTLNPIKHIDLFGSIILPLTLIFVHSPAVLGWAKPVPVNFMNLKSFRRDTILVSVAGCLANFGMAIILSLFLRLNIFGSFLGAIAIQFIWLNLVLGIFNLIPIPPLDGSKILMSVLPKKALYYYFLVEPFGIIIIFALLSFGFFDRFIYPLMNLAASALIGRPLVN